MSLLECGAFPHSIPSKPSTSQRRTYESAFEDRNRMSSPELDQLKLLAEVDDLTSRLRRWAEMESPWEPISRSRALVRRLLTRVDTLRVRLESPLVVATFGGTGTGKSTLVNALVGQECSTSGRQRPTTTRPVLIAHVDTHLDALPLPLDDFEVVTLDAPILRDILIIDCPDPDTNEAATTGSNLERLRQLLPLCDVLVYTSTQQKYRSARVVEELGQAASGCRLLFVQTHADLDSDIREDWRQQLSDYAVPDVFFVDSVRALQQQQSGERPTGDFARLQDIITSELAATQRVRIRRANIIDLIAEAVKECDEQLAAARKAVTDLQDALAEQRHKLTRKMADHLRDELSVSSHLWERRALGAVTEVWGVSPFSSILRLYHGMGGLIASFTLFRARNSAQLALIGAMQGAKWLRGRQKERDADARLEELHGLGLDDATLREAQVVIAGHVRSAKFDRKLVDDPSMASLRDEALRVEDAFLVDARSRIEAIIQNIAVKNTGWFTKLRYEVLFLVYVFFVLYRVGKYFFWDSFLAGYFTADGQPVEPLDSSFYIAAGVFFALWTGALVLAYTHRLRRGLTRQVNDMSQELAEHRMTSGVFPQLESACHQSQLDCDELASLVTDTTNFRSNLAESTSLGSRDSDRAKGRDGG